MIFSAILSVVLNILFFAIGLILAPFRLLFPSIQVSPDSFTGSITYIFNSLKNVQNIFIYFSSSAAFRILMLALIVNFVIVTLIKQFSVAINLFIKWILTLMP